MSDRLRLISHKLCPYVQRAVIALTEKGVAFERVDVDLANKPDWFLAISPLGRTPVLQVGDTAIFESAVILEYLEETQPKPLHPPDPLRRADHRGWIEFGSTVLSDIAGLYSAPDEAAFKAKATQLEGRFTRLETRVVAASWFDGSVLTCGRGLRSGVPLFRRVRRNRRLRHLGQQAQAIALAPVACGTAVGARGRQRGLSCAVA
jgi:glutathione S-transferase